MELMTSLIVGILVFVFIVVLTYEPESQLRKRFKRAAKVSLKEKSTSGLINNLQEMLKPFSEKNLKSHGGITRTKKLLLQAGYASGEDDIIRYETKKILYLLFAIVASILVLILLDVSLYTLAAAILFILVAYRLPEIKIQNEIKVRQKEFMKFLPDAVDLLSICVQAGLGLDASFAKVADEFKLTSATIATEFDRLNKDILSGLNRQDAYKNLVLRNENPDLQSFVALLIQTDRLGTSITQSLEAFCDSLRTKKRQRIEELSQQASTKMTLPMVLFMLPAIFIIIMYPAMQKIMTNLGGM